MPEPDGMRESVAAAARMLAAAGLIEGFGHVSARSGEGIVITSTRPLLSARAGDILLLDRAGQVVAGPGDAVPLETPLHLAVYAARPDLAALARGHGPATVAWGTWGAPVPLRHGLGLLAGRHVGVWSDIALISTPERAAGAAAAFGTGRALLMRGNGAIAGGDSPVDAATTLYALEERCAVAVRTGGEPPPGAVPEVALAVWKEREIATTVERARARAWFATRFGAGHVSDNRPAPHLMEEPC